MGKRIRIATRRSRLALWQAGAVARALTAANPGLATELVGMATQGDRDKGTPLGELGGKGVFVKELEVALLEGRVDLAVHSMKDLPGELPEGLVVQGMLPRGDARDALVSGRFGGLGELPAGAVLGSSSLRRRHQLQRAKAGLGFADLRGNVETRLAKLDRGDYDGIVLAVAGLARLGLGGRIAQRLPVEVCIPAAGQGAIGMEARAGDAAVAELIGSVNHPDTQRCVLAERAVAGALGATCNLPIAAFAEVAGGRMTLRAFVASQDGGESLASSIVGAADRGEQLGAQLGQQLIDQGALQLLPA